MLSLVLFMKFMKHLNTVEIYRNARKYSKCNMYYSITVKACNKPLICFYTNSILYKHSQFNNHDVLEVCKVVWITYEMKSDCRYSLYFLNLF